MKKVLAALFMTAAMPAFAVCSYPLDATQAQFDQLPFLNGWQVPPVVSSQTMEFTVQETGGGLTGMKLYAAFSSTGVDAMTTAYNANLPGGDVTLPSSGIVRVQMHIDSFPWQSFSMPRATLGLGLHIMTGNPGNPLPKDSLDFSLIVSNSTNTSYPFNLSVVGQSISGSNVASINQTQPFTPPPPSNTGGFYLNMDTREVGLTYDGADQPPLKDRFGNPVLVPAGVSSIALGLVGFLQNVQTGEALVGAPVGATLITDICSPGANVTLLPNGKSFPGKGKALGLQK